MNILYYDLRQIKLPDPTESDEEDDNAESHFISIGKDSRYRKGHMLDIYVSIVSDMTHKIIIHVNEQ
jgi:hypothetical protein